MTEITDSAAPADPRPTRRKVGGGYLFLPRSIQRPAVLTWLRRVHAWTGFWGALFFFCLGLSGIYLNHRAVMRVDQGVTTEVASLDAVIEPGAFSSEEEFIDWLRAEYEIAGEVSQGRGRGPGGPVSFNGQPAEQAEQWSVNFRGPNSSISASHVVGSNTVHVTKTNSDFIRTIIDLHKVIGVDALFILLMDTMAGGMMIMALTGLLLWTRLHGPRLLAGGIVVAMLVWTVLGLAPTWVSANL